MKRSITGIQVITTKMSSPEESMAKLLTVLNAVNAKEYALSIYRSGNSFRRLRRRLNKLEGTMCFLARRISAMEQAWYDKLCAGSGNNKILRRVKR